MKNSPALALLTVCTLFLTSCQSPDTVQKVAPTPVAAKQKPAVAPGGGNDTTSNQIVIMEADSDERLDMNAIRAMFGKSFSKEEIEQNSISGSNGKSLRKSTANFGGGDGTSPAQAVIVQGITDKSMGITLEYAWMFAKHPKAKIEHQSLKVINGTSYNVFSIKTASGKTKEIYFDRSGFPDKDS